MKQLDGMFLKWLDHDYIIHINIAATNAGVGTDILAGATDGTARTTASAAYDKANAANSLAYNTGIEIGRAHV